MKQKLQIFIFLLFLLSIKNSKAICDFSIDKTTVCAGEIVTVQLAQPYAKYHNIIVYKGVFPFGSIATSPADYTVLLPYDATKDNTIKITFRGSTVAQQYKILLAESNSDLNPTPTVPCNGGKTITVNPSPDPELKETNNFVFCNAVTPQNINITNVSNTQAINTNYTINWGDGSPVVNTTTFNSPLSHNYAPGSYKITYTVTGNTPAPCNTATKIYNVLIGKAPTISISASSPTVCIPANYELPINLAQTTGVNSTSTLYKVFVNGELDTIYDNSNLPGLLKYTFTKGSCGTVSKDCNSDNKFSIRLFAVNECDVTDISQCIIVLDSIRPVIDGRDTVCLNDPNVYRNIDQFSRDDQCGIPPKVWTVTPATGFTTGTPLGTPTQSDLNITFTTKGTYFLKLKVTGACNEKDTTFKVVVIDKVTAAAAFASPSCIDASGFIDVPITNNSTDPADIIQYIWNVNPSAGTSYTVGNSNTKDVTIRFTKSGSYNISLTAVGGCNQDTWDSVLVIKGKPAIDTLKIPQGCFVPYVINPKNYFNYTNGGDNNATFSWTFTGGIPLSSSVEDPGNITYNNPGTFPITLLIRAQCGDSTVTNFITVNNNIRPNAGPDFGMCIFDPPIRLSAVPPGGVWRGNGITDSVAGIFTPSTVLAGTYSIAYVLNPTSNCPTTDTVKIRVAEIVGLTAGPDQTICKGSGTLQLIGNPLFPGGSWTGTGVVNTTTGIFDPAGIVPGNYQIGYVYTDTSGSCKDTAYKKVTVFDSVHVSLPPPTICVNQPFNFGTISGNISAATWNFGDATPDAIIINPSHTYTNVGNYVVTLYAETPDKCKDTIKIPIKVVSNPPLSFLVAPDTTCTGNNVVFSFPPGHDTATNYVWDFGISTVQSNTPVSQQFSFPKPVLKDTLYFVTLRADYFCGPSFYTDTVKVKASPKADFGVQPIGCSPFTPILANTSYGSPTNFLWNFGNGQTTNSQSPTPPTYTNMTRRDSIFTISLKVSNVCGSDSIRKNITVKANDVFAKFFTNINQGCQPLTVDFFNISSPGAEVIWDFGDGSSAYADQVSHEYDSAGVFKVKLLAIGSCGRDSFTTTVNVFDKPKPDFDVLTPCVNTSAQFVNKTTNGNSYVWDFGDGTTPSTRPNPTHIYNAIGVYDVKLIVANSRPCVDSITKQVRVSVKPTAAFSVVNPSECEREPTVFLNSSVNGTSYLWYLGNGETSTEGALSYIYPNAGIYNVTLTAINGECRDSISKVAAVEIYPKPIAAFLYEFTGNGFNAPVAFTNTTVNGTSFFWMFGDGDTSVLKDPGTHQYSGEGPYRVTLFTISSKGCKDTVSHPIGVDYSGQLYVPNVFSPEVGVGESAIWKPKGLSMKEYHVEVFSTYGQLLWESTALENGQPVEGWDGRWKGTILPQDVYVWKIRAIFTDGKAWEGMKDPKTGKKAIMGSVVLLR
ncbi:MAG: PKD domain-containing protein [Chitinophagales bacterium]